MRRLPIIRAFIWTLLSYLGSCGSKDCEPGWFGSACQYKCHCGRSEDNSCDDKGACTKGSDCEKGWFGPACQYEDLSQFASEFTSNINTLPPITDGDDTTCNDNPQLTTVSAFFNDLPYHFTWMRITVREPKHLQTFKFELITTSGPFDVTNCTNDTISDTTLDIHCAVEKPFTTVKLLGKAVTVLCSIFISGECPAGLYGTGCKNACNADCGGTGKCNGETGACTEGCEDGNQGTFCLEECPAGLYGIGCKNICNADCGGTGKCDGETGACIEGCQAGKQGNFCLEECPAGFYGLGCENICNAECGGSGKCDGETGACTEGCQNGRMGLFCLEEEKCPEKLYGIGCKNICNAECGGAGNCDFWTGNCTEGCQAGRTGALCLEECPAGFYGIGCENICNAKCGGSGKCDGETGACTEGCQVGRKGPFCLEEETEGDEIYMIPMVLIPLLLLSAVGCIVLHGGKLMGRGEETLEPNKETEPEEDETLMQPEDAIEEEEGEIKQEDNNPEVSPETVETEEEDAD